MATPKSPSANGNGRSRAAAETDSERSDRLRKYWEEQTRKLAQMKEAEETTLVTTTVVGTPKVRGKEERPVGRAVFRTLRDVEPREYDWLWEGRIPIGEPVIFFGDCDQGKSMLSVALAATVTTGGRWPDLPEAPVGRGSVVFIQDEDTVETTLRPRVDAAGGDPALIHSLDFIEYPGDRREAFSLVRHMEELEAGLAGYPDARLLVIDPVSAYLGCADEHSNAEVRGVLRPLSMIARRRGLAVILINHVNKGAGVKANYRAMGSSAFINAPRAAYLVASDPDDDARRLVAPSKFNLGLKPTGLAYRFEGRAIRWEKETVPGLTANALLARERQILMRFEGDGRRGPLASKRRTAEDWLARRLEAGATALADLVAEGEGLGFSRATIGRALKRLKAQSLEAGGLKCYQLPPELNLAPGDEEAPG